jgi:hypothetical protein
MKQLLDFNPLTGEKVFFDYEESTGRIVINHEQDVELAKDVAHHLATDGSYSSDGIKRDWWHYAKVPNIIIMDMKNRFGVNFFDKNDEKRMFELLNTEYKVFKTTEKTHVPRR